MAETTGISWADATFNPWIGCTKVSLACDHCYAETLAVARLGVEWGPHAQRRRTAESTWKRPLAWNRKAEREGRRLRVFCASLADVFDNAIDPLWRADLFMLIKATPHLDWLLLTKRPQNIRKMLPVADWGAGYPNVWLGTTVENQVEADRRIPHLLDVPAAKRFLSCEPLLGPIDLRSLSTMRYRGAEVLDALTGKLSGMFGDYCAQRLPVIDWIITGGESGKDARPSNPEWFRSLRDQCSAAGVPFHFKQWGEWAPMFDGGIAQDGPVTDRWGNVPDWMNRYVVADGNAWASRVRGHSFTEHSTDLVYRLGTKRSGHLLDGVEHHAVPA